MPGFELTAIVLLGAIAWVWYDSIKARDICIEAARQTCRRAGHQLLDDTVAITAVRLARNDDGRLLLERRYGFEFSISGTERRSGSIVMQGHEVTRIDTGPYLAWTNRH